MSVTTYRVPGMTCAHCVRAVESEVGTVAGVSTVHADLDAKVVRVEGDAVDDDAVRSAIAEAGYEAE